VGSHVRTVHRVSVSRQANLVSYFVFPLKVRLRSGAFRVKFPPDCCVEGAVPTAFRPRSQIIHRCLEACQPRLLPMLDALISTRRSALIDFLRATLAIWVCSLI
jgi:hypothetical protein